MSSDASALPSDARPWLGAIAGLGALITCWGVLPYGIASTPDSAYYLSSARNLRAGLGYASDIVPWSAAGPVDYVTSWPPLYSLLVASLGFLAVESAALLINVVIGAVVVLFVGAIVLRRTGHPGPAIVAGLATAVSPALVETNLYALSEPLFTLLLLGCTWSLARLQATGRERYVIAAGLTAGLGTLCRYVGGIALVAGAILLLMERREGRARLGNLLRFAVLGSLPIAFWCLRNYLVTGRPVGLRRVGVLTFPEALESMRRTAVGLFIPDVFPETLAFAIVVGFAVLAATLIARAHRPSGRTPVPLSPFVVMMACYLSAVAVLSTWIVGTFPNSSRSLAPIVPIFGIVLACLLFEAFGSLSWHSSRPRALVALGALALPLVAVPAAISARLVLYHKLSLDGAGYHAAKWRRSDLIVAIKERRGPFAAGPAIFSNEPEAIHTLAGGRVYSVRGVWEAAFERPDELHRAATRAPSVLALMHSDESEAGRWTDAALENSGLFARAARFEGGCVYVPVPATDRRTALARD